METKGGSHHNSKIGVPRMEKGIIKAVAMKRPIGKSISGNLFVRQSTNPTQATPASSMQTHNHGLRNISNS